MPGLRPISHEDRLSVIDHLDELRTRLIIIGLAFVVVFALCFWQNGTLIKALNRALPNASTTGLANQARINASLRDYLATASLAARTLAADLAESHGVVPDAAQAAKHLGTSLAHASQAIPKKSSDLKQPPITIGVGESFTTTLTVVGYFALLFTLPLLLYQLYAFVIPALSRDERKIAVPSLIAAPLLFLAGATFSYFEVLPPAIHFLQGYNSGDFQILVQAKSYYRFEIFVMMGIGLAFQVPLLLLALQKVGLITARTLTGNWRYATVLITIIVAALPGVDPVTMIFETIPLVVLYLASIVMLRVVEYRTAKREAAEAAGAVDGGDIDAV